NWLPAATGFRVPAPHFPELNVAEKTAKAEAAPAPGKVRARTAKENTAPTSAPHAARQPDGWRETIESIVVAFVLAFLFRTFEAEAFVIPTGSMAPTLYGQQRDVVCTKCGTRFAVGASTGSGPDVDIVLENSRPYLSPEHRTHYAVCPNSNCRFPNDVLKG